MPRCLMAKKWKAYPWQDRPEESTATITAITATTTPPIQTLTASNQTRETIISATNTEGIESVAVASAIGTIATQTVDEDEEIDVVGDSPSAIVTSGTTSVSTIVGKTSTVATVPTCWGPSSPTAGTTAPSPPPHSPEEATRGSTILYNGKLRLK